MNPKLTLDELKAKLKHRTERPLSHERVPTGFHELDKATGGGFMKTGINEFLLQETGCGLIEFLLQLFRKRAKEKRSVGEPPFQMAWIHPTLTPYPPAAAQCGPPLNHWLFVTPCTLAEQLWAIEQILRSGEHPCVIAPIESISDHQLRRLGMAAIEGKSALFLIRPLDRSRGGSASNLRIKASAAPSLTPEKRRFEVEVLRCRGVSPRPSLFLEWSVDSLDEPVVS